MVRHTVGIITVMVLGAMIGYAPAASAQVVAKSVVADSGKIQIPDLPVTPMKSTPDVDFRGLRMGQKSQEHAKAQVGPVEFESRPITVAAPWQPYQEPYQQWTPFFQRAHTDFSWSFYLHWKPQ